MNIRLVKNDIRVEKMEILTTDLEEYFMLLTINVINDNIVLGDNMEKRYHKENLKEKIVIATLQSVKNDGYESVTIRSIASKLDVSSTALYRHFSNIFELMQNVIDKCSKNFAQKLIEDVETKNDYVEQIIKLAHNFLAFALEERNQYMLLFFSSYAIEKSDLKVEQNLEQPGIKVFMKFLKDIKKENNLNFDVEELFLQFWSFILGYSTLVTLLNYEIDDNIIRKATIALIKEEE